MGLYDRLSRAVGEIQAVDTHVHLFDSDSGNPLASSLWDVLSYHNYTKELVAAGMPPEVLTEDSPPDEKMAKLAGYFPLSSTTMHAWMVRQVLSGLYDRHEPVTPESAPDLCRRAEECLKWPGWEEHVFRQARISKTIGTVDWRAVPDSIRKPLYAPMTTVNIAMNSDLTFINDLERDTVVSVKNVKSLEEAIASLAEKWKNAGMCAVRVSFEDDIPPSAPGPDAAGPAFTRYLKGKADFMELDLVRDLVLELVCREAGNQGLVVQMYLGARRSVEFPYPARNPELADGLFELIASIPGTKFDLATVSPELLNQLTIMTKHLPNLYLQGCWWFVQFPRTMWRVYRQRFETLPPSKWSVMFTDAYVVEWSYAKSMLIRKEFSRALASYVEDGYITEDQALGIARDVMYNSPARLYGLSSGDGVE